jgi:type II secretion system protein H
MPPKVTSWMIPQPGAGHFSERPRLHSIRNTQHAIRNPNHHASRLTPAFTLVELLLVMTVMVMSFAIALPTVAKFFRGRTLDSEARRLLAMTRGAQGRAVSEGAPMQLWVDARKGRYGLQEEPGWTERDPKAVTFKLDPDLQIEVVASGKRSTTTYSTSRLPAQTNSRKKNDLPEIRFVPDGTFDDTTPQGIHLSDRNGISLWVVPSRNHLNYEIRNDYNP